MKQTKKMHLAELWYSTLHSFKTWKEFVKNVAEWDKMRPKWPSIKLHPSNYLDEIDGEDETED